MLKKRGFSLIELIVVVAILGILMLILFPQVAAYIQTSKEAKAKQECSQVVGIANIELVSLYASNSLSMTSDNVSLINDTDYMENVYSKSNASENSIKSLKVNTTSIAISYAEYVSSDDIHVYYNGMIYSLDPLVMSEYSRILSLLSSSDSISKLAGTARTQALQKAALSADGQYTSLTDDEVDYLKKLVEDNNLAVASSESGTYTNMQWVPISTSDGKDVIMVATNLMTNGKTGAVTGGDFIYYKGKYFYKSKFKTGSTDIGGYSWVSDDGSITLQLDNASNGDDISDQYWKIFTSQ